MTRMTRPDCVVMCNLINTHTHTRATSVLKIEVCSIKLKIEVCSITVGFSPILLCWPCATGYYNWGTQLNPMNSFCPYRLFVCSHLPVVHVLTYPPPRLSDWVDAQKV